MARPRINKRSPRATSRSISIPTSRPSIRVTGRGIASAAVMNNLIRREGFNEFVSTWDTTQPGSAADVIILPYGGGIETEWGDGTVNTSNTHTYATSGTYTIKMKGPITGFRFNNGGDREKLISIDIWGRFTFDNNNIFYGCTNLQSIDAQDTPRITAGTKSNTFRNCTSLAYVTRFLDWDTREITNFSSFFRNTLFNEDLISLDARASTSFSNMFRDTPFSSRLDNWQFGPSGINATAMFRNTNFNNNSLDTWDFSKFDDLNSMFRDAPFNQPVSSWDVSNVVDLASTFRGISTFDQDLSAWDVSSVTAMGNFLQDSNAFSTSNYDLLLQAWEQLPLQSNVSAHFGDAQYSAGAPATARGNIITNFLWTITDGGPV